MRRELIQSWLSACLLLFALSSVTYAAAPSGSWWNTSYPYRYKLVIAGGGQPIVAGYSVALTGFNHSGEVGAGRSLTNGNDVRIVYWNGNSWQELDRALDPQSSWNTAAPQIWFKTQAVIAANATDDNYYVYFGHLTAGAPPADETQIFMLFDQFNGTSLSSTRWSKTGAPSVNGGVLTLPVGSSIRSWSTFGVDTMWEASLRLPSALPNGGSQFFYYWMAESGGSDVGFFADTSGHNVRAKNSATTVATITPGNTTGFRRFRFARESTNIARYWLDGTEFSSISTNVPGIALQAYAFNDANGSRTQEYDWVRVRAYRAMEPTLVAGGLEQLSTSAAGQFVITHDGAGVHCATGTVLPFAAQTAGDSFQIHIAKYIDTSAGANCRIDTDYQGEKTLAIWSQYVDPGSGSVALTIATTPGGAAANVSTTEGASTFKVTFVDGQAQITGRYRDVGSISFTVKEIDDSNLDAAVDIRGGSGPFVVRPAYFSVTVPGNAGASNASAAVFRVAGDPFNVTVTARESGGNATPNYGRESQPESVVLVPTAVGLSSASNGTVSGTFGVFNNGAATSTNTTWSEAGIVQLTGRIGDGNYLGAGDIEGVASGNIGRFTPADFLIALQTGKLKEACGSFSYLGQPLKYENNNLVLTVTARNRQGATTTNYRGAFFKLDNGSVTNRAYSLLDDTAITHANAPPSEWVMTALNNGTATLTFSTGTGPDDGLVIARAAPRAPFDAKIKLRFGLTDADGVTASTVPVTIGEVGGLPFANPRQLYGRLAFRSVVGSERVNLPMPLHVEYYVSDASGFSVNTADTCTVGPNIVFSEYAGHLEAGEVSVASMIPSLPADGSFNLVLSAPGEGNDGKVKVQAGVPGWLQIWNPTTATFADPWGVATFGLFQGNNRRVYQREMY